MQPLIGCRVDAPCARHAGSTPRVASGRRFAGFRPPQPGGNRPREAGPGCWLSWRLRSVGRALGLTTPGSREGRICLTVGGSLSQRDLGQPGPLWGLEVPPGASWLDRDQAGVSQADGEAP